MQTHWQTHTRTFMLEGTPLSLNLSFTLSCQSQRSLWKPAVFRAPPQRSWICFGVFSLALTLSSQSSPGHLQQRYCGTNIILAVPAALPNISMDTFNSFLEFFSTNFHPRMFTIYLAVASSPASRNPEMSIPSRWTKVCLDSLLS